MLNCFRELVSLPGLLLIFCAGVSASDAISPEDRTFFENRIRPVLVNRCYECHSADSKEVGGKLLLDSPQGLVAGGQSGPAIVPGKPDESLLIQALQYDGVEMPPEKPLSEAVVNDFIKWIKQGAPDPRTRAAQTEDEFDPDDESLWSFRPRTRSTLPQVENTQWARDPIDRFVLAELESRGLTPAVDADARTLARRLYYDLIGLPPTMAQIEAFQADYARDDQAAVERLVDRLLASPQFGVKWGRHWLDVARYGESNGDDGLGRNASFPHAWRYRDYVVDAFNSDLPYDRFLTEQIAGDLLPAETAEQRNRQLVATGFLAIGAKPAAAMNKNFAMDVVDDQINVVSKAVMGLSVSCARCHDHKHDPIPTRDYYAMAGFFTSTETLYGRAANEKLTAPPTELHQLKSKLDAAKSSGGAPVFPDSYNTAINDLQPQLHARLDVSPEELTVKANAKFSPAQYGKVNAAQIDGQLPDGTASYSVAFWFKNDTKNNARPITAYLFSRAKLDDKGLPGDHLGIGGTHDKSRTGKLFVFNGNDEKTKKSVGGTTIVSPGTWNHVVMVRDGSRVRAFLNGNSQPEIDTELPATFADPADFRLAARSDGFAPLVGNVAYLVLFDRAISADEAQKLHAASGQPRGVRALGLAMGVRDKAKPADCKIHIGGETGKLGPVVPRGFLTAYQRVSAEPEQTESTSSGELKIGQSESGRQQLAAWLTRPGHPQTARVMVNRIWLHLFGRGIVSTPDDLGVYGARPSHPQLLDHLAERFVEQDWSVKQTIRAIVLSRTYQLGSTASVELVEADPNNRWYARHSRRRLDAEAIRDSMLQASGELDLRPADGSAVQAVESLINWPPGESTNLHRDSNHRSVYLCMLRHAPPAELVAFNLPSGVDVVGQRDVTTLPTQSLYLMNSPFVIQQAQALAERILQEPELDQSQRIRLIFSRTLQRDPTDEEVKDASELLAAAGSALASSPQTGDDMDRQAWTTLCHAIFATNEFRYVD